MRTTGVVTAEEGRLGTPSLLAIGDATAGLVVHMPGGAATYQRGARLEVTGKLAAPYGQLEIRPARADIRVLGTASLPAPMAVPSGGLSEATEGRLVTTVGKLTAKPKRSATGDIRFVLDSELASRRSRSWLMSRAASRRRPSGGRDLPSRRVRRPARDASRRPRRLPHLGSRETADIVLVTAPTASRPPSHHGRTLAEGHPRARPGGDAHDRTSHAG